VSLKVSASGSSDSTNADLTNYAVPRSLVEPQGAWTQWRDQEMVRARIVVTIDYEADLADYPGAATAHDVAVTDIVNLRLAPHEVADLMSIAESIDFEPGAHH
jgi:hypothetical protein